jgi:hypothetical protein
LSSTETFRSQDEPWANFLRAIGNFDFSLTDTTRGCNWGKHLDAKETVAVWKQVVGNLKEFMPAGIKINQITAGHAKEFHEKLKARGMATTTIHKRIQFARQFMHDAVDWKIIDENPFCKVRTQRSTVKVNEFVPREVVDKLMKKANPVWQVILGLSRYPVFLTTEHTEHTETNPPTVMSSFRKFGVFRGSLLVSDKSVTWSLRRSIARQSTPTWAGKIRTYAPK